LSLLTGNKCYLSEGLVIVSSCDHMSKKCAANIVLGICLMTLIVWHTCHWVQKQEISMHAAMMV